MPTPEGGDGFDAPVVEGLLWGLLLVVALVLLARSPKGARWGWGLVAAGLLAIVADKAFDVHAVAHAVGTWIATSVDPENQLRGPNAIWRHVAFGVLFVAAGGAVVWMLRHDAAVGRAKVLCLAGLVVIGALLGARLSPGLEEHLPDWLTKVIELVAWLLVLAGQWLAVRRPAPRRIVDGFL